MITVGIATWNEGNTIGKVLDILLDEDYGQSFEIIVVAGGNSIPIVKKYSKRYRKVKFIEEKVKGGKPRALNIIFKKAKGDYIILTDGEVFSQKGFAKALLRGFVDKTVGAVSGNPKPTNSRNTMLGFWQHFLNNVADIKRKNTQGRMLVSGYLYCIKKGIVKEVNPEALADDAVISYTILSKGYKIRYAPDAVVMVKYPTTISDWMTQKKRNLAGHYQTAKWFSTKEWRSFGSEASGFGLGLKFAKTPKELIWFFILVYYRLLAWFLAFWDLKVRNKGRKEIWTPVETTK